jgi:CDP-diacylglycerol--serine O-phosphatidyltransferase
MNIIKRNIPNAITCLNLLSGVVSIIFASKGDATILGLSAFHWAYIFIAVAAVADFLDGFAARALGAYSDMGKELDSLCDMVSFGVAPAFILYKTLTVHQTPQWVAWLTPLIAIGGALRLARFNTDTSHSLNFTGLPIPANAIFWIGFTAWYADMEIVSPYVSAFAILALSYLMVSRVKMYSLKFKSWSAKENWRQYTLPIAAILLVCLTGLPGLMWTIIYYVLLSLACANRLKE